MNTTALNFRMFKDNISPIPIGSQLYTRLYSVKSVIRSLS